MEIKISSTDVNTIRAAGQVVTLAQSVIGMVGSSTRDIVGPVAWQAFEPLEANRVTWSEQYDCFATMTSVEIGAVMAMAARTGATLRAGWIYTFQHGQFSQTKAQGGSYIICNATKGVSCGLGLAQRATVNGLTLLTPIAVQEVLFNESATFTPTRSVSVFLSGCRPGEIVGPLPDDSLMISFGDLSRSAALGFNGTSNTFYQTS